jgi:CRISPR-associated endonuclease/helicase Cas3
MKVDELYFWAKTTHDGQPGISVYDHCLNVGCVAEALINQLPGSVRDLLPQGAITLAALHDVGKISAGFLRKCPAWLIQNHLEAEANAWATAESDHSKVSQYCLQRLLEPAHADLWAAAVGAHHGRVHGRRLPFVNQVPDLIQIEEQARSDLVCNLAAAFSPLPERPPLKDLSDLWLLAGLIAVADWIASNEAFFSPAKGLPAEDARHSAQQSLATINWHKGRLRTDVSFPEMFGLVGSPNVLQTKVKECASQPGLIIVEGPMGSGKTEAALSAAHELISAGHNQGLYFALPTQVTSNRIHLRVANFLRNTLAETANLRLAHASSWLGENQNLSISPTAHGDSECSKQADDTRSWFASSKQALLARYGVGTIDQALQAVVAVKHFFVRRFGLAGKVVILDEVHSYDVYTGALVTQLIRELLALKCSVIVLSATLTRARRLELLSETGAVTKLPGSGEQTSSSEAYPLVTVSAKGEQVAAWPLNWSESKTIHLQVASFAQAEVVAECLCRALAGQQVLCIRNTVAEAQATYRAVAEAAPTDTIHIGLLHSRFPYFRREQLEDEWLQRLGKDRTADTLGSILVATQVVEQSVDIDLDFIVSDLAPTDMLLQRMGRLWRHPRHSRPAQKPEFWINVPEFNSTSSTAELKASLGKSGRVYSPYVLLRTAKVFSGRQSILVPEEIRTLLEATYPECSDAKEPDSWRPLRDELIRERDRLANEATAAMRVLGTPSQTDRDEVLTRRSGAPTCSVVLVNRIESFRDAAWRVTGLDGKEFEAHEDQWCHETAKALYFNSVRTPRFTVPRQKAPRWLSLHTSGPTSFAIVEPDGSCLFPEADDESRLAFTSQLGLFTTANKPQPLLHDYDDEFDF